MKFDRKLQFLSANGLNLTHFGDSIMEYSKDGDAVEVTKGIQGDAVTLPNYTQIDRIRTTLLSTCPLWGQIESWEKNHTAITLQYKDANTGVSRSSTTAYIQSITYPVDGGQGEVLFVCEEVH